jgi:hypothetical protein
MNAQPLEAIREVCHQHEDHPEEIWEALEEKGIHTTPGMIHQALMDAEEHAPRGLGADDLETLRDLVHKAGGVDGVIRVLEVLRGGL